MAVLKDAETRMDNLAKHIKQASQDVSEIHVSADKISSRFEKIERVELEELGAPAPVMVVEGDGV